MGKNYRCQFAESRTEFGRYSRWSRRIRRIHLVVGSIKKGNQKFPIGVTSEGIKKIAILDTLLGNRYLDANSIVFIDEPESALHPVAVSDLLDIIAVLAKSVASSSF